MVGSAHPTKLKMDFKMQQIQGLKNLINNILELPYSWVFVRSSINRDDKNELLGANFFYCDNEDEESILLNSNEYRSWLMNVDIQAIIENKKEVSVDASFDELIDAILYYRKYDAFME